MHTARAVCVNSSWVSPPRAYSSSARPHAAALRRGEEGPNLFTQCGGRGWGGSNKRLSIRNALSEFPTVERTRDEELERIKAYRVPDLVSPYPWKRNQFADNAKAEAYRWLDKYIPVQHVYESPEELRDFRDSDLAEWAVLSFVDCGEKELAWPAKLTLMTFILDDDIDDWCSPEKAMSTFFLELIVMILWSFPDDERLYQNFVEFLDEGRVADRTQTLNYVHSKMAEARLKPGTLYDTSSVEAHWIIKAFGDLWAELYETMPDNFLRRWALLWQIYLLENVKEVVNRRYKITPSVHSLTEARRHTTGFWIFTKLLEFAEKVHVPDEVYDCPEMQRFLEATGDALAFDNDLWSFQREAMRGDKNNMVVILSHSQDCSYVEAGMKTHQMMLDKLAEMEKAIVDVEKVTPPEYQEAISLYIRGLRNFYAGTHHWYEDCTSRYRKGVPNCN
uniref:Terpene synthase n=1 Tax=Scapania nemorea TaxID=41848 RepID=A0A1J0CQ93_SCANE|nr:terpene synthase 4 [Scapania nemorea]